MKSSDVQVLENVQREDDDFYNYPYVSLPTLEGTKGPDVIVEEQS